MKSFTRNFVVILFFAIASCNKTRTVNVVIRQQSAGQAALVSDSAVVLLVNNSNRRDFKIVTSSAQGVAVFNGVNSGYYKVSSQVWDGSKGLQDSAFVQLKNSQSATVNLLLR